MAWGVEWRDITSPSCKVLVQRLCKFTFWQEKTVTLEEKLWRLLERPNMMFTLLYIVLSCILNFHRLEIPLPQFDLGLDLASVKAPHLTIARVKWCWRCFLSGFIRAEVQGLSVGWNLTVWTGKKWSITALTSAVKEDVRSCIGTTHCGPSLIPFC